MGYAVHGITKSRTQLSNSHFHFKKFHSGKGYKSDKTVILKIIHQLRTPRAEMDKFPSKGKKKKCLQRVPTRAFLTIREKYMILEDY